VVQVSSIDSSEILEASHSVPVMLVSTDTNTIPSTVDDLGEILGELWHAR
jgi:hypothetical protein